MSVRDVRIPINRNGSEETASLIGAFTYAVSYMANGYNDRFFGFLINYKSFPYKSFSFTSNKCLNKI